MVKKVVIVVASLAVVVVGCSIIVAEIGNREAKPIGQAPKLDPTIVGDRILKEALDRDANEMQTKRGQVLLGGLTYGMTLGDAQRLLGAGHSAFSVSGPITPDNEQFQARFPDPADASHEILVTVVYGGAFKAQFIGMVEDSFSASTPSGANK